MAAATYGERLLANIPAVREQARRGEETTAAMCALLKQWSAVEARYAASLKKLGASALSLVPGSGFKVNQIQLNTYS